MMYVYSFTRTYVPTIIHTYVRMYSAYNHIYIHTYVCTPPVLTHIHQILQTCIILPSVVILTSIKIFSCSSFLSEEDVTHEHMHG